MVDQVTEANTLLLKVIMDLLKSAPRYQRAHKIAKNFWANFSGKRVKTHCEISIQHLELLFLNMHLSVMKDAAESLR